MDHAGITVFYNRFVGNLPYLAKLKKMAVIRGDFFLLVIGIGFGIYTVAGVECPVAKEPISFTGDPKHSVNFMWDCLLLPNESVQHIQWFKEHSVIATVIDSTFTSYGSFVGRLERFGTFGLSLHNISVNDSGHYMISVLLNYSYSDNRGADTACQKAYLPALPEELWEEHVWNDQLSDKDEASSLGDQQGLSKLEIGLICGFVLMAIFGLGIFSWHFYRKRRNTNRRENENTSPEQSQML